MAVVVFLLSMATVRAASLEVTVRDTSGGVVPDAAVYATPASGPADARNPKTVEIAQVEREFVPYVTVVQSGTPVSFPNRDPILHHVYSFSPAKPFEIKLYTGRPPGEIVFDKPGVVTLGCNIHDWMIAYIVIVATPYFARTDANGVARLRDLPAGTYEVKAYHPRQRAEARPHPVTLEAAASPALAFVVDTAVRKTRYKPPLDRSRY
jgi:plastocyanin